MSGNRHWRVVVWSWFALLGVVLHSGTDARAADAGQQKAQVYVTQGSTGNFSNVLLYLDGKYIKKLTTNSHIVLTVDPGLHEISTAGTTRVALSLNAKAGNSYFVRITVSPNGLPQITTLSDLEGQKLVAQTRPDQSVATVSNSPPEQKVQAPALAARQTSGLYVGVGAGLAQAAGFSSAVDTSVASLQDVVDLLVGPGLITATGNGDDSGVGAKLFIGYAMNQYVAFEGFYINLGEFKVTASAFDGVDTLSTEDRWKASGLGFAGLGLIPIGNSFAFFGKLGITYWNLRYDAIFNETVTPSSTNVASENKNGISPLFGFGVKYDVSRRFGLRFEYERTFDVGKKDTTGQFDIDLISLSGVVKF